MLLPLGDFSLIKDLPQMYQAYQKLAPPQEQGIVDFVGDYLLNGKTLLGHNKHDAPENGKSNVQFQHTASFCSIVITSDLVSAGLAAGQLIIHQAKSLPVDTSDFHAELFRPPLAA